MEWEGDLCRMARFHTSRFDWRVGLGTTKGTKHTKRWVFFLFDGGEASPRKASGAT